MAWKVGERVRVDLYCGEYDGNDDNWDYRGYVEMEVSSVEFLINERDDEPDKQVVEISITNDEGWITLKLKPEEVEGADAFFTGS